MCGSNGPNLASLLRPSGRSCSDGAPRLESLRLPLHSLLFCVFLLIKGAKAGHVLLAMKRGGHHYFMEALPLAVVKLNVNP